MILGGWAKVQKYLNNRYNDKKDGFPENTWWLKPSLCAI